MEQLFTRWGRQLDKTRVLPEYPRPQMEREDFINLNGYWEYAITKTMETPQQYDGRILVPFSPESVLSEVGKQLRPEEYLWYRRVFLTPGKMEGHRLLLHFGAVDQACKVFINGKAAMQHIGGYLPFEGDITEYLHHSGENELIVLVRDFSDTSYHARGKQRLKRGGMFYTAQSGIWQTVWMERVPVDFIKRVKVTPLYDESKVRVQITAASPMPVAIEIETLGIAVEGMSNEPIEIQLQEFESWTPENPVLYYFTVKMGTDCVRSYFAMRLFSIETDGLGIPRMCLNHNIYFQKGVLDQGYWPDGLYTAPNDEAFIFDIQSMKDMGFNMIRKHIKIEPQRWYYHCDRLGMIVWQDMVNGGSAYMHWYVTYFATLLSRCKIRRKDVYRKLLSRKDREGCTEFVREMKETAQVLYSHPSIAVWVIFNEGWGQFQTEDMTKILREEDHTRLIDQASGWFDQGGGDFQSLHNYFFKLRIKAENKRATVLSEFGGYSMRVEGHSACKKLYGYGIFQEQEKLVKAYLEQDKKVQELIKDGLCASIYTQLSDVEEEVNGIWTYDREIKKI